MTTTDLVHVPDPPPRDDAPGGDEQPRREKRDKHEAELLRLMIAERLVAHIPYRVIAAQLGISKDKVCREVKKIRAAWRERATDEFQSLVDEEVGKLDALERYVLPTAMHGGKGGAIHLSALDRALAIMDRRARLLGLDKPVKIDAAVTHVEVEAQRARARELYDEVGAKRDQRAAG